MDHCSVRVYGVEKVQYIIHLCDLLNYWTGVMCLCCQPMNKSEYFFSTNDGNSSNIFLFRHKVYIDLHLHNYFGHDLTLLHTYMSMFV